MYRRTKAIPPLLRRLLAIIIRSLLGSIDAYPGYPCSAFNPKCHLPCRLKRLKVLIGLKECFDAQSIEDSECEQEE